MFPRAVFLALPNAMLAWILSSYIYEENRDEKSTKNAVSILAGFSSVLFFVLYFRSNIAYDRWWEGGTLLQKTRGEWFNAYSSLIAFSATDPAKQDQVEEFHHLLARLMSLLFCCGLQQVSPNKDRGFEIIDTTGIEQKSLQFLNESSDKVEVILQWIQRSTVLHMQTGVLPVAPPVLSRAFQEVSRGIVNLQNARKIADFPFPFPFAQTSMVMLLIHWAATPILCGQLLQRNLAAVVSFSVIFFIWCINYIALQLEQPFGSDANDLPMGQMQREWNKSLGTLLAKRAQRPPMFEYNMNYHRKLEVSMSDGTDTAKRRMTIPVNQNALAAEDEEGHVDRHDSTGAFGVNSVDFPKFGAGQTIEAQQAKFGLVPSGSTENSGVEPGPQQVSETRPTASGMSPPKTLKQTQGRPAEGSNTIKFDASAVGGPRDSMGYQEPIGSQSKVQEAAILSLQSQDRARREGGREEKHQTTLFPVAGAVDAAGFEQQLRMVGVRMKELHGCLIDEELGLLSALGTRLVMPDARRKAQNNIKPGIKDIGAKADMPAKDSGVNVDMPAPKDPGIETNMSGKTSGTKPRIAEGDGGPNEPVGIEPKRDGGKADL